MLSSVNQRVLSIYSLREKQFNDLINELNIKEEQIEDPFKVKESDDSLEEGQIDESCYKEEKIINKKRNFDDSSEEKKSNKRVKPFSRIICNQSKKPKIDYNILEIFSAKCSNDVKIIFNVEHQIRICDMIQDVCIKYKNGQFNQDKIKNKIYDILDFNNTDKSVFYKDNENIWKVIFSIIFVIFEDDIDKGILIIKLLIYKPGCIIKFPFYLFKKFCNKYPDLGFHYYDYIFRKRLLD